MEFQAISWLAKDREADGENTAIMHCWGKDAEGRSVHLEVPHRIAFYLKGRQSPEKLQKGLGAAKGELDLRACGHVMRQDFVGFRAGRKDLFTRFVFTSLRAFYWGRKRVEKCERYETNVDPILKYLHATDLLPSGWITVDEWEEMEADGADIHATCKQGAMHKAADQQRTAPLVVCSYDIECYSASGDFPDANKPEDPLTMIGATYRNMGTGAEERYLLCLGECAPIEGVEVESLGSEGAVIERWNELLVEKRVDVLLDWNGMGFDYAYIWTRGEQAGIEGYGKLEGHQSRLVVKEARGTVGEMRFMDTPGVAKLDLMLAVKKEHNLDSYSLNNVSKAFLENDQKIDLSPKEQFVAWRRGRPEDKAEIGRYCVQDTALPLKLIDRLNTIPNSLEMSNATSVPMDWLLTRGQSIKCFSQVLRKVREKGMLCPSDLCQDEDAGGYTGATVIDPMRGVYWDPVAVLDFASCKAAAHLTSQNLCSASMSDVAAVYPSIFRANGLCCSALVLPGEEQYGAVPGVEYLTVEVRNDRTGRVEEFKFAQTGEALVPELLRDLAEYRAAEKKAMKTTTGALRNMHDAKQLAYKISMNSLYGLWGCSQGYLPCRALASSTTAIGRQMIFRTKSVVEENFPGACVVYGDTLRPLFPPAAYTRTEYSVAVTCAGLGVHPLQGRQLRERI